MLQPDMFGPSLAEAKAEFYASAREPAGTICPCCDRFGKIYAVKLNAGMANTLLWLYQNQGFQHLPTAAPRHVISTNSVGKLAAWGMAEAQPNDDDPSKKHLGIWRITAAGIDFVEGRSRAWSHVIHYNQTVMGFREDKKITISQALGRPFHYQELMRTAPGEV